MKIVSTSYSKTTEYISPEKWLKRIAFYTGILEELAKRHEVVSIERISYEGEYRQNGVRYRFINLNKEVAYFPFRMHNYIKRQQPDVVLVNGLIFPFQVLQLRMKLGKSVKLILIHRSEKPFTGIKKLLFRFADRYINAYLFTSSELGKLWIEKGIIRDKKKLYEVMHASSIFFPDEKLTTEISIPVINFPVFLWVGRLNENKDPLTVVSAFKNFLLCQPSAILYMIYQSEELLEAIKKIVGENEKIILVGKVEHKNLQHWYNTADFIISGSHYEGGGIAVCEAMSCGCIPVVTSIISFQKMTGPGKCGLLYEAGNDKDLSATLIKTKELDIELEKKKVLKQFKEELSFEAIAGKIERVIESL